MVETRISKSQRRALRVLGLPQHDTYAAAARHLDDLGYPRDGMAPGCNWRESNKLDDARLLGVLRSYQSAATDAGPIEF